MIETMLTIIVENHVDFAKKIYITYNLSINIGFVISKLQAIRILFVYACALSWIYKFRFLYLAIAQSYAFV